MCSNDEIMLGERQDKKQNQAFSLWGFLCVLVLLLNYCDGFKVLICYVFSIVAARNSV